MGHRNNDNGKLERRIARSRGRKESQRFPGSRQSSTTSSFVPPISRNYRARQAAAMAGIALLGALETTEGQQAPTATKQVPLADLINEIFVNFEEAQAGYKRLFEVYGHDEIVAVLAQRNYRWHPSLEYPAVEMLHKPPKGEAFSGTVGFWNVNHSGFTYLQSSKVGGPGWIGQVGIGRFENNPGIKKLRFGNVTHEDGMLGGLPHYDNNMAGQYELHSNNKGFNQVSDVTKAAGNSSPRPVPLEDARELLEWVHRGVLDWKKLYEQLEHAEQTFSIEEKTIARDPIPYAKPAIPMPERKPVQQEAEASTGVPHKDLPYHQQPMNPIDFGAGAVGGVIGSVLLCKGVQYIKNR